MELEADEVYVGLRAVRRARVEVGGPVHAAAVAMGHARLLGAAGGGELQRWRDEGTAQACRQGGGVREGDDLVIDAVLRLVHQVLRPLVLACAHR